MATKILIDSLEGPALAWAVVMAMGKEPAIEDGEVFYLQERGGVMLKHVIRLDNDDCENVVESAWIGTERPDKMTKVPTWRAIANFRGNAPEHSPIFVVSSSATDRKSAIFRCFVKSMFGEKIELPESLGE